MKHNEEFHQQESNLNDVVKEVVATVMASQAETVTRKVTEVMAKQNQTIKAETRNLVKDTLTKEKQRSCTVKRSGLQDQYDHQLEALEQFEEIERAITENDLEEAKSHVENGKKLLSNRSKLLKLSDRENWNTVTVYTRDKLASDTDDERQINKAVQKAAAKSKSLFS